MLVSQLGSCTLYCCFHTFPFIHQLTKATPRRIGLDLLVPSMMKSCWQHMKAHARYVLCLFHLIAHMNLAHKLASAT
jgi:hypothetical protein